MAPSSMAYTLPVMQVVCNLVIPDDPGHSNNTNTGIIVNQTSASAAILPKGYTTHPDIGAAFKIYNESVTWKVAREKCIAEGAKLAVIDSYLKFKYLINQTQSVNAIHVGVHRMYDDTEWVSDTTGSTLLNLPWAPGNPTGAFDCVVAGYIPRGLRNLVCTTKAYYACELKVH